MWDRAQLNECVKLYHFKTNERCHTPEELPSSNFLVIIHMGRNLSTDLSRPKLELLK